MEDKERIAGLVQQADVVVRCVSTSLASVQRALVFTGDFDRAAYSPRRSIHPSRSSVFSTKRTWSRHRIFHLQCRLCTPSKYQLFLPLRHYLTFPFFRALASDTLLLNEIGLDPGIDHCSAHSLLSRLRSQNKQIVSFTSFCGGLPAPEAAEGVPLGYKFSWSPRGVLRAAEQGAKFRLNGKVSLQFSAPSSLVWRHENEN